MHDRYAVIIHEILPYANQTNLFLLAMAVHMLTSPRTARMRKRKGNY